MSWQLDTHWADHLVQSSLATRAWLWGRLDGATSKNLALSNVDSDNGQARQGKARQGVYASTNFHVQGEALAWFERHGMLDPIRRLIINIVII